MNKVLLISIFLINILCVKAQNHTYFMGKRHIISIGTSAPLYSVVKYNPGQWPINIRVGMDRILNSYLSAGIQYNRQNTYFNDVFTNDGSQHNYSIYYNNQDRRITDGNGQLSMASNEILLNVRKYNRVSSYIPIGAFYSLKLGFSMNTIAIPEDYTFKYTQLYNSGSEKVYISDAKQILGFRNFIIGAEYGKTFRFLKDKMFLTTTICVLRLKSNKFSSDNLISRFKIVGEERLKNNNFLNFNLALSYAI